MNFSNLTFNMSSNTPVINEQIQNFYEWRLISLLFFLFVAYFMIDQRRFIIDKIIKYDMKKPFSKKIWSPQRQFDFYTQTIIGICIVITLFLLFVKFKPI